MNQDLRGKKLLILGGSTVNCKFVNIARSLGITTIVTDINPDAPAKKIADVGLPFSVFDTDKITAYCVENGVSGVANFSNTFSQLSSQEIIRAIGGYGYGSDASIVELTEKNAFKAACVRNGVDIIDSYTEAEITEAFTGYPIMVKPDDNSGSRGIAVCRNYAEAAAAMENAKRLSNNGDIVIEKFLENRPDFTVTYYVVDGEPYINRLGDRFIGAKEDNLDKTCICTAAPSKYSKLFLEKYDQNIRGMLKELKIRNGPVFMQGFVDGDKIRFYDPGARYPGGGEYEASLKTATGIDYAKMSVVYAVSGETGDGTPDYEHGYLLGGYKFVQLSFGLKPGKIGAIEGMDIIREQPYVCSATLLHQIGDEIGTESNTARRFLEVCMLVKNDPKEIVEKVKKIQSTIVCTDVNGSSMLAKMVQAENIY